MPSDHPTTQLGRLLRDARQQSRRSQAEVAEVALKKSGARLGQYETGVAVPPIDELVRLHLTLGDQSDPDRSAASLLRWIAAWVEALRARREDFDDEHKRALTNALQLLRSVVPEPRNIGPAVSLADFPEGFLPLQIVVGDRREIVSKRLTMADLFSLSMASSDLMFLPDVLGHPSFVREPARMWSDKITVLMPRSDLEMRLGSSNLLIVGSPAVNLGCRIVDPHSLFRFDIERDSRDWDKRYRSTPKLDDDRICWLFFRICEAVEESAGKADPQMIEKIVKPTTDERNEFDAAMQIAESLLREPGNMTGPMIAPKRITYAFRRLGFQDPADRTVHGVYTADSNDFGVVSLAPNPWAAPQSTHVAIIAAGIHGPGTAVALKQLATPHEFAERPYGGVLEVDLGGRGAAWPDRMREARARWQTLAYTPKQLLDNLTNGLEQLEQKKGEPPGGWLARYDEDELEQAIRFVKQLAPELAKAPGPSPS
jgi:transcriptional regulator with XRE-family HTH domain